MQKYFRSPAVSFGRLCRILKTVELFVERGSVNYIISEVNEVYVVIIQHMKSNFCLLVDRNSLIVA
jgi:hypothetical protein